MPMLKNIKYTISNVETVAGVAEARAHVIPIAALPGLDKKAIMVADPVINGDDMDVGDLLVGDSVEGPIPISPRACPGFGKLVKSNMGSEVAPAQVAAMIRIKYTGASASCKLVANTATNTLKSYVGALGAEVLDNTFGTSGSIDLTAVSFDTVGELVAAIEAYASYTCEKLNGADSVSSGEIITVAAAQAKNQWAQFHFTGAATGAYAHIITPNFADTERPTYSIQRDGFQDNYLYDGEVVDILNLAAALKGFVSGDVSTLGFKETKGQVASVLTLESAKAFLFSTGSFSLSENVYNYIRSINLSFNNHHDPEGYGMGGLSGRQYHAKGEKYEVTGSLQLKLDAVSVLERDKVYACTMAALSLLFKGKIISGSIYEMMLIELPFVQYKAFDTPDQAGRLEAKIDFAAKNPAGTKWDNPVTVTIISADAAAY